MIYSGSYSNTTVEGLVFEDINYQLYLSNPTMRKKVLMAMSFSQEISPDIARPSGTGVSEKMPSVFVHSRGCCAFI